jgi:long-chain fatty acid transport protein
MKKRVLAVTVGLAITTGAAPVWANNGMENIAYSAQSEGRGGTAIAVGDDTSVMNTNPALLSNIENGRVDASMTMMFPQYSYQNSANNSSGMKPIFVIPTMGLATSLNNKLKFGIAFFNEGGTGTDYGSLKVPDPGARSGYMLAEYYSMFGYMVVTPTLSYTATDNLSLGISAQPGFATARMKMPFDMTPIGMGKWAADMNMHDYNYRTKLGALYKLNEAVGFGFAYTTKADINLRGNATMQSPNFTGGSSFMTGNASADLGWPSSYKLGTYWDMRNFGMPRMSLDIERLKWSQYYKSVPFHMTNIAWDNGPGPSEMSMAMNLGWDDQTVYKLGFDYPFNDKITMRMGWSHGKNPVPASGLLAIMNPIVEDHYTMGLGINPNKNFEFNMAMTYGVRNRETNNTSNTVVATTMNGYSLSSPGVSTDMNGTTIGMKYYTMSMGIGYKW